MPIVCQAIIDGKVCGYSNPDGLDFCDDCGSDLRNQTAADADVIDVEVVGDLEAETQPSPLSLPNPPSPTESPEMQETADKLHPPTPSPISPAGKETEVNGSARLVILRNGPAGKAYTLDAAEISIGRWDADNGHFPEIDLTDDDMDSKISRSHAKITFENGRYFIEDLGSLNGTFVNRGTRLVQGQKTPLNHNDELIMGKIFFRFEAGGTV